METTKTYTLEQIQKELGAPSELQAKASAPTEPDSELIARGKEIASERILTDVERLYGLAYAFWVGATAEQKEALAGFSEGVLRYAVDRALALRRLTVDTASAGFLDEAELKRRKDAAAAAFTAALSLRDKARNVLKKAAPNEETKQTIDDAIGTAEDDEKLKAALGRLVTIGATLLKNDDEVAKLRAQNAQLTPAYLQRLSNTAEMLSEASKAAAAPATVKKVSQGDIDLLDGVNLALLNEIIVAFEDAHDADPTIPRLVPISTRRLLGKRSTYPKKEEPTQSS